MIFLTCSHEICKLYVCDTRRESMAISNYYCAQHSVRMYSWYSNNVHYTNNVIGSSCHVWIMRASAMWYKTNAKRPQRTRTNVHNIHTKRERHRKWLYSFIVSYIYFYFAYLQSIIILLIYIIIKFCPCSVA